MKPSTDKDYLYASGRIRALEGKLLNRDRARRMIESRTPEEAFRLLGECGYEQPAAHTAEALEDLLSHERRRVFDMVSDMIPDQRVLDLFRIRYDVHNVKALLKSAASGTDTPAVLLDTGRIRPEALVQALREMALKELPPQLANAAAEARDILARTGDPQQMEISLDQAALREMLKLADDIGNAFLLGYVRLLIDTVNLRTVVRLKRMGKGIALLNHSLIAGGNVSPRQLVADTTEAGIEYLFSNSPLKDAASAGTAALRQDLPLRELDRRCDNALTIYLRPARGIAFGLPLVVAYLAAKEAEITALRTILTGRLAQLTPEVIQERIRDHYV